MTSATRRRGIIRGKSQQDAPFRWTVASLPSYVLAKAPSNEADMEGGVSGFRLTRTRKLSAELAPDKFST